MQIVLFNNKYTGSNNCLILRIRHYSSERYKDIRRRKKRNDTARDAYRKQWHSFRLGRSFNTVPVNGEDVPLEDYFVKSGKTYQRSQIFKIDSAFQDYVRKYGWNFRDDESQFYKRHQPKIEMAS